MPLDLKTEFTEAVKRHKMTFKVRGLLSENDRVYTLGTDTKVLSTVFELYCQPLIREIAEKHGLKVVDSPQTVYPDFTLMRDESDQKKIAIDIKTTYRRPLIFFTLGSYTSFLRDGKKNIRFPLKEYASHWVIGFVYDRTKNLKPAILDVADRAKAECPYESIEWFVQEKHKIAGESPGSGNTANIGSMKTEDLEAFKQGLGPFAKHGPDVFKEYWANYAISGQTKQYRTVDEFLQWKNNQQKVKPK